MAREYPDSYDVQPSRLDPERVLEIWNRRKWLALLVSAAVFGCAVGMALGLPDLYRASAKVLIDHQDVSESFVRPSVTSELEARIQRIHEQISSRSRLGGLIDSLKLYPELAGRVPQETIVDRMRKDIHLQLQGVETSGRNAPIAFTVSYSGRDPKTTAEVANRLASFYVEANTRSREQQAARTAEFLGQQVASIQSELDQQERRTTEFVRRFNGELPQQIEVNMSTLGRLSSLLQVNAEHRLRVAERRERLEKELAEESLAAGVASDASIDEAHLTTLKQQLAALRGKFSERYPEVIRLRGEIATLEGQIATNRTGGRSARAGARAAQSDPEIAARFASLDAETKQLEQEEASLRRQIAAYEARVAAMPARQREIEQISRGRDVTRAQYESLVKQYEDARIAASLEGKNGQEFRVLDSAIPPTAPAAPNRLLLMLLGLGAALVTGFVAIVVAERLDTTFHSPDQLREQLDLPVLATVPSMALSTEPFRVRQAIVAGAALAGVALIAAGSWYLAAGNEAITRLTARGGL